MDDQASNERRADWFASSRRKLIRLLETQQSQDFSLRCVFVGLALGAATTAFDHSILFNVVFITLSIALFVIMPQLQRFRRAELTGVATIFLLAVILEDPVGSGRWLFTVFLVGIGIAPIVFRRHWFARTKRSLIENEIDDWR